MRWGRWTGQRGDRKRFHHICHAIREDPHKIWTTLSRQWAVEIDSCAAEETKSPRDERITTAEGHWGGIHILSAYDIDIIVSTSGRWMLIFNAPFWLMWIVTAPFAISTIFSSPLFVLCYQASIHIHVHIPINDRTRFSLHNIVRSALCLTVPSIPNHYTQSFPFFRYIRIHVSPILDR